MGMRYIELDDICHLNQVYKNNGDLALKNKRRRESYYFNMTDPNSKISLITTIGILPNRKLITGFILIIKDNKIMRLRPLIQYKTPIFNDHSFYLKGLEYKVDGPNWILRYNSEDINFNLKFEPINKVFQYITREQDLILNSIGSQHYEQFGIFKGEFAYRPSRTGKDELVEIGPCFGHRDHSWGIRDWSLMERYRLFCCAFSKDLAFNLWEGWLSNINSKFVKGFVFNGEKNFRIIKSKVDTKYYSNTKIPDTAIVTVTDQFGNNYSFQTEVNLSIPVPPKQSLLYECLSEMEYNGNIGYGLTEYLFHEPDILSRGLAFLKLFRYVYF
jgi:hypothetical protein